MVLKQIFSQTPGGQILILFLFISGCTTQNNLNEIQDQETGTQGNENIGDGVMEQVNELEKVDFKTEDGFVFTL